MLKRMIPWVLSSYLLLAPLHAWAETLTLQPAQNMSTGAQQIPAGAKLKIRFITPIDAQNAYAGDVFLAEAAEDLWAGPQLILPKGTGIRGRILDSQKAKIFSKGAQLRLSFDHLVMPSGEINPIYLQLDPMQSMYSRDKNALYTDPGVSAKLNASVDKGIAQYNEIRTKGKQNAEANGGTLNKIVVGPATAIAGFAAGTGVTTVNAVKSIFGKGESVVIEPGDTLILDFSQNATLPIQ